LRIALLLVAYLVLGVLLSVLLSSLWSWVFWLSLRAEAGEEKLSIQFVRKKEVSHTNLAESLKCGLSRRRWS
jgi:hypothetical protein